MVSRDVLGALLSVISSAISIFGVNLQKVVHNANEELEEDKQRSYLRSGKWWFGMCLVIFGAIGDFIALGFASQALCTALGGATTLLVNVVIARYWVKEELTQWDILGAALIIIGAITISVVTPQSESYTLDELLAKASRPAFRVYMGLLALTMVALLASVASSVFYRIRNYMMTGLNKPIVRRIDEIQENVQLILLRVEDLEAARSRSDSEHAKAHRRTSDLITKRLEELERLKQKDKKDKRASGIHTEEEDWSDAYTYAACAGVMGATSVILAGVTSKTLISALEGDSQWHRYEPYLFIVGMLATIFMQQALLNAALQLGPIMTTFPMFQAFFIGFGVIGGVVFYETRKDMSWASVSLHGASAIVMVLGCLCLMRHGKKFWQRQQRADSAVTAHTSTRRRFLLRRAGSVAEGGARGWGRASRRSDNARAASSAGDDESVRSSSPTLTEMSAIQEGENGGGGGSREASELGSDDENELGDAAAHRTNSVTGSVRSVNLEDINDASSCHGVRVQV
eukprot:g6892.t1